MSRNESRYTILDGLPKIQHGQNAGRIDWERSVGYSIPFKYDEIYDEINIIGYKKQGYGNNKHRAILSITIDKYVTEPIDVRSDFITNCQLHNLVGNRIANKAPHLIQYLLNPEDAYRYTYRSNQMVATRCPICGHEEMHYVDAIYRNGFYCPVCSDTATIPNKIMFNVLQQLNIDFIRELNKKHFKWTQQYLYDFYFKYNDLDIIVEMDGFFHQFETQKQIDEIKTALALNNGFKLIRIDCIYKNVDAFEYIKKNILQSELSSLFDLNRIDWDKCKQQVLANVIHKECKMWESGFSVGEIMDKFHLSKTAVRRHLLLGKQIGICMSYNKNESRKRASERRSNPVAYISNDTIQYVFINTREAAEKSMELFGVQCSESGIQAVCAGIYTHTHNLHFKHITREEYEQYKMITDKEKI